MAKAEKHEHSAGSPPTLKVLEEIYVYLHAVRRAMRLASNILELPTNYVSCCGQLADKNMYTVYVHLPRNAPSFVYEATAEESGWGYEQIGKAVAISDQPTATNFIDADGKVRAEDEALKMMYEIVEKCEKVSGNVQGDAEDCERVARSLESLRRCILSLRGLRRAWSVE